MKKKKYVINTPVLHNGDTCASSTWKVCKSIESFEAIHSEKICNYIHSTTILMVDINPLKWETWEKAILSFHGKKGGERVQDRFTEKIFCFSSILQKWTRRAVPAPPVSSCPTLGQHSTLLFAFAIGIHHPTLKFSKSRLLCKGSRKSLKELYGDLSLAVRGLQFCPEGQLFKKENYCPIVTNLWHWLSIP